MAKTSYISSNGMIIGEMTSGVMRAYGLDALGSVVSTYTGSSVENAYQYKPFGATLAKTGAAADPSFLWNGGSGYRATGLVSSEYFVRTRHYATGIAKWTTVDTFWPSQRAYVYVLVNPISRSDPSGLCYLTAGSTSTPLSGSCPGVGGTDWFGCTNCNLDTGYEWTVICNEDCQSFQNCIEAHEAQHRKDHAVCCYRAFLCRQIAFGIFTNICDELYNEFNNAAAHWSECRALAAGIECELAAFVKNGCNSSSEDHGGACCNALWRQLVYDQYISNTYCDSSLLTSDGPKCCIDVVGNPLVNCIQHTGAGAT